MFCTKSQQGGDSCNNFKDGLGTSIILRWNSIGNFSSEETHIAVFRGIIAKLLGDEDDSRLERLTGVATRTSTGFTCMSSHNLTKKTPLTNLNYK